MTLQKIIITTAFFIFGITSATVFAEPIDNSTTTEESNTSLTKSDSIIHTAMKYIGTRYRRGTAGPTSFDCSGFTSYVFGKKDIKLSRDSRAQYKQGTSISSRSDLRRGDLVFFGGRKGGRTVGHVGIVKDVNEDGTFTFVHAARSGVRVDKSTAPYYSSRYIGAKRVLHAETN